MASLSFNPSQLASQHLPAGRLEADVRWLISMLDHPVQPASQPDDAIGNPTRPPTEG